MAHTENTGDSNLPTMYNLDLAVGVTISTNITAPEGFLQPNRKDDVMLVQYLLKGIYGNPTAFQPPLVPPDGKGMVADGLFGPTTKKWIHHFQIESKKRGNNIATDGVVDPARHGTQEASISHTYYTIVLMNFAFRKAQPSLFPNIALDVACPPELKLALGRVMASQ